MEELSKRKPSPGLTTQLELLQKAVESLPPLEIEKEAKAFSSGGGVQQSILTTSRTLDQSIDQNTIKTTVALFNYLDKYADAIGGPIDAAMAALPEEERTKYLDEVNVLMTKKIADLTIWAGEDRQLIGTQALSASAWFKQGKADLLTKSGSAIQADKLKSFLSSYAMSMDPKGYGRRVYSLSEGTKLEALPSSSATIEKPATNVAIPHTQPGYEYYEWNTDTLVPGAKVAPSALVATRVYALHIHRKLFCIVTVASNTASAVTFSDVVTD